MCLAVPSEVLECDGAMAIVESFSVRRQVSLMLMAEPVAVGDFLLIQAGGFAVEKVDRETALVTLALMAEALALEPAPS
jgi:hydrogenase expression/formation protein HypC